jgi:hypothetical protein
VAGETDYRPGPRGRSGLRHDTRIRENFEERVISSESSNSERPKVIRVEDRHVVGRVIIPAQSLRHRE